MDAGRLRRMFGEIDRRGRRTVTATWPWMIMLAVGGLVAAGMTGRLSSGDFNLVSNGLQVMAVVLALGVGAAALRRDSHDRRVDRVMQLHQELMTGELWAARRRIIDHFRALRADGEPCVPRVTRRLLQDDPAIGRYAGGGSPYDDMNLLVRYFERANVARASGAVEADLFVELVGRHALAFDHMVVRGDGWMTRAPLADLADWTVGYTRRTAHLHPERAAWLEEIACEFPHFHP